MSIAELIMTGTNRASESTAWVGDSLAKLGQNVGQALAQREQQKQAQEMLPFLQQSMQESMSLAGSGKTGEAYAKLMPFLTDPSVAQNPFMMPALEAGIKMNQIAADDFLRKSQIDAYKARYSGGTGGGGGGLPRGPQTFFGTNPADNEPLPTQEDYVETVDGMPADNAIPGFTGGFSAGLNEPAQNQELPWSSQMPDAVQPTEEVQQAFQQNKQDYLGASPDKRQAYQNNISSTTTPVGTNVSEFDFSNIKSLRNVVGIAAPIEKIVEVPESMTMTESNKGTSFSTKFNKKTTNENIIAKSGDLVLTDVPKALNRISSNKTLSKFFSENELGSLDIGSKEEKANALGKKEASYYIGIPNKKDSYITISQDDFIAASTIQNLPSSAKTLDSTLIITDKPIEPAAEAPAQQDFMGEMATQYGPPPKSQKETAAQSKTEPPEQLSSDNPFAEKVAEKESQKAIAKKQSIESQKENIQNSISDLEDKLKILTAVGQRNPEILPDYLRRKMGAYMNASPSRNAKDFEDTKKQIDQLRARLKSL